MKKIILAVNPAFWLLVALLFWGIPTEMLAQQKATIDENYKLVLDTSTPLGTIYEAALTVPSSFDKEKFLTLLDMLSDQHIRLEPKLEESKVLIEILSPTFWGKPMSVEDWNDLLNVKARRIKLAIGL